MDLYKKNKIARILIGLSILLIFGLMFVEGPYKKCKHESLLVQQKHFYQQYKLPDNSNTQTQKLNEANLNFSVIPDTYNKNDKIFLITRFSDSYIITYGSGLQAICSYFPQSMSIECPEYCKAIDNIEACMLFTTIISLAISFFLVSKSSINKQRSVGCVL